MAIQRGSTRVTGSRRGLPSVGAALACAVAIAACGSSGATAGTGTGSAPTPKRLTDAALKFASCMRTHGVSNFPDPSTSGGGIQIKLSAGLKPFSPAFQAAQKACQKLLPGGGPGAGHPSAQAMAAMLKTSQCMRAHGVTGFPDPTTKPPANPQGYVAIEDRNGVVIAIPDTINPQSPAFKQAAAACGFR